MKLSEHLKRVKKSPEKFASEIGTSGQSIRRYLNGERFPRPTVIAKIAEVTGGKVTERDWYRAKFGPLAESHVA